MLLIRLTVTTFLRSRFYCFVCVVVLCVCVFYVYAYSWVHALTFYDHYLTDSDSDLTLRLWEGGGRSPWRFTLLISHIWKVFESFWCGFYAKLCVLVFASFGWCVTSLINIPDSFSSYWKYFRLSIFQGCFLFWMWLLRASTSALFSPRLHTLKESKVQSKGIFQEAGLLGIQCFQHLPASRHRASRSCFLFLH